LICTIFVASWECKDKNHECVDDSCRLKRLSATCYTCYCGSRDGSCEDICDNTYYYEYDNNSEDGRYVHYFYDGVFKCYCDQSCMFYNDCCDDHVEFCLEFTEAPTTGRPTSGPTFLPTYGPTTPWPTYSPTKKPSRKPTSVPTLFPTFQMSPGGVTYVTPFFMSFEEHLTQSELEALASVICPYCFGLPGNRCAYEGSPLTKTYLYKITAYSIYEAFFALFVTTHLYEDQVIALANIGMKEEKDALGFSEIPTLTTVLFGDTVLVDEEGNESHESYLLMIITILGVCTGILLLCVVALCMVLRNRNKRVSTANGGMELQPHTRDEEGIVTTTVH